MNARPMLYLYRHFILITGLFLFANNLWSQTNGPVVIPVVFHILHLGGPENISDAQVMDALQNLNRDYNKQNADTISVIPFYKNNIANMGITFRLANIDPNGNCTNGIEHIYSNLTDSGGIVTAYINDWPRNQYLNIWTYKSIPSNAGAVDYFPWLSNTLPGIDGIAILNNYIGSIGTGNNFTSRAPQMKLGII